MKLIHINHSDNIGGAARAMVRIHKSLLQSGLDSTAWVNLSSGGQWTVETPKSKLEKVFNRLKPHFANVFTKILQTDNPILHSPGIIPSKWVERINRSDADIINLHWINAEMLSVADIGRIKKPIIWTLHDMWAFCGAEHLAWDDRWKEGYRKDNRPSFETGFDLNRWTWKRKLKNWKKPLNIVTPSKWLAECVRSSYLMKDWPVTVIPNTLNVEIWKPIPQAVARQLMGFPPDVPLAAFGSFNDNAAHHKGFNLLTTALGHLRNNINGLELVIFGQLTPKNPPDLGFPVHYTGHLHDDLMLCVLYSAVDVLIVPSRIEAFGQAASEAHACGTPVVAFDVGGHPDIIEHKETGYLAKPFDTEDLAKGILWVIQSAETENLGVNARNKVVETFSYPVVTKQYIELYEDVMAKS